MKIIISQSIKTDTAPRKRIGILKKFESDVIPHEGDFIKTIDFEGMTEVRVNKVAINYEENECVVYLQAVEINSSEQSDLEKHAQMFVDDGWECPDLK